MPPPAKAPMPSISLVDVRTLAEQVDAATFARAVEVRLLQRVLSVEVASAGVNHWQLSGRVQGSGREVYNTQLDLQADAFGKVVRFAGQCSCPVASNCKHAMAMMLSAAYKFGMTSAAQRAPAVRGAALSTLMPAESTLSKAEQQLLQWLAGFDDAEANPAPSTQVTPNRPALQATPDVVYLLDIDSSVHNEPRLALGAYASRYNPQRSTWAKPRPLDDGSAHDARLASADRDVLRLLKGLRTSQWHHGRTAPVTLAGQPGLLALQLAAATGRLFCTQGKGAVGAAVRWQGEAPIAWHWQQACASTSSEPLWALIARMAPPHEAATLCHNDPPMFFDAETGACGLATTPGHDAAHLRRLLATPPLPRSAFDRHADALLQHLAGLPLPPDQRPARPVQGVAPVAELRIQRPPSSAGLDFQAELSFIYGDVRHHLTHARSPCMLTLDGGDRVLLHRDLGAEARLRELLLADGLLAGSDGQWRLPPTGAASARWLGWLESDFAHWREHGIRVVMDKALRPRIDAVEVLNGGLNSSEDGEPSANGWFDLSLGLTLDGQRYNILPVLPQLLAQLDEVDASAPIYLPVGEGHYARVPGEALRPWLAALMELFGKDHALPNSSDQALRLSRLQALQLGLSLGEGVAWEGAKTLKDAVQALRGGVMPDVPVPQGLQAELRSYQLEGLRWLQFLHRHHLGGILADDMGLGKTLQTLAHILAIKESGALTTPCLVLAPVSVLGNWQREAERFAPSLNVAVWHGSDRHQQGPDWRALDVLIAPYSLLQRDRERWMAQRWHLLVLDEAQSIKNAATQMAQVAAQLPAEHRLCLSGTPMENHLGELWSLFHFLMPGFLGSQRVFTQQFRTPIEKHGDGERQAQLRRRVTPFMLRRSKQAVAADLPPKQDITARVALGAKQANLYESIRLATEKAVREALAEKGLARSQIQVLDALLKLRQVCCDPRLLPLQTARNVTESAKLERLMEMLPELVAEGRRILLFSQFTSMLGLIEEALAPTGIAWAKLTGQSRNRPQIIERFTGGEVPLFLISLKAGGVGLNLTQADTVIHFDPWWNPAVETQATDRAHRIGQTQQVMVYKLVAEGTIEERMLALQTRKAALADAIYSGSAARKQPLFTEDDLAELLSPLR